MNDYMVRATAADGAIRAFAVTTKNLVEYARVRHDTSPVMTAALGRLLSAGTMMGAMMKGEKDILTLQIQGDGPGKGLTVTADSKGNVKGYPEVSVVALPPRSDGHLNVGGAMGNGVLRVIKDMGLKEPYVGEVDLQTGEIAEDLTYYFAASEQIPSVVGLGVLVDKDGSIAATAPVQDVDYKVVFNEDGSWDLQTSDGYYYYTQPVAAKGKTSSLIKTIKPLTAKEGYTLKVDVIGSVIQATPTQAVVQSWGVTLGSDGTTISK